MAGVQLCWASNNPEFSGYRLILITEEQYHHLAQRRASSVVSDVADSSNQAASASATRAALHGDSAANMLSVQQPGGNFTQSDLSVDQLASSDWYGAGELEAAGSGGSLKPVLSRSLVSAGRDALHDATADSGQAEALATEEIFAHKIVLVSSSDYFAALIRRWSTGCGSSSGPANQDGGSFAVISLPSEHHFDTFRQMIHFLYTQMLDEGMERCKLMELLVLGDEYGVASLRCACLQQLSTDPLRNWSVPEKQQFCSIAATVQSDVSAAEGQLAEVAEQLVGQLLNEFHKLESVWQNEGMQAAFCCLPADLVLQILRSSSLSVACEDTVLVAAISWLRTGGKDAPLVERGSVLHAVRLLFLSPWLLSWLTFFAPEGAQLLPPHE
jgi:hypothetical protein